MSFVLPAELTTMNELIQINPARLKHQQKLFAMSNSDVLAYLNEGRKNKLAEDAIFGQELRMSHLRKIDKLFKQGLYYYTDPVNPSSGKNASIFFRKSSFHSKLNLSDRQQISQIEDEINYLNGVMRLSNFGKIDRHSDFSNIRTDDSPSVVAEMVRGHIKNDPHVQGDKEYLKSLIEGLANVNIFVCEFIEHPNKKLKMNVEGAFIAPHWIAIKRNQRSLKREIFTLCHELGHYLLKKEDIDDNPTGYIGGQRLSKVERWCNDFAFHLLYDGDWGELVSKFKHDRGILNAEIVEVSSRFHLSRLAIYTQMFYRNEITRVEYQSLRKGLRDEYRQREELRGIEAEQGKAVTLGNKAKRIGFGRPIRSPLIEDVFRHAYFERVVDEINLMNHLGLAHSDEVDVLLYGESL